MCLENGIYAIYIPNRGLMPCMTEKHLAHFRGGGGGGGGGGVFFHTSYTALLSSHELIQILLALH